MKLYFPVLFVLAGTFQLSAQPNLPVPQTQQSLVTKLTATWCSICGGSAWETQKKLQSQLGASALVMAAHTSSSSRLYSATAAALLNNFDFAASQPVFFYNTARIGSGGTSTENTIISSVQNAAKGTPLVQAGISAMLSPGSRELDIQARAQFFKATEGSFTLSLLILEDSVVMEQAARSASEIHRNVLRASAFQDVYGQPLASGTVALGTSANFRATFSVPASFNANRLRVAAVIWKKNGSKYEFVNLNIVPISLQSVTSTPADIQLLQGFQVSPNLLEGMAKITVQLPRPSGQVVLEVFDQQGRRVRQLFSGRLGEGQHEFLLHRQDVGAAGLYFLRLRSENAQAVRPVVVPGY